MIDGEHIARKKGRNTDRQKNTQKQTNKDRYVALQEHGHREKWKDRQYAYARTRP